MLIKIDTLCQANLVRALKVCFLGFYRRSSGRPRPDQATRLHWALVIRPQRQRKEAGWLRLNPEVEPEQGPSNA